MVTDLRVALAGYLNSAMNLLGYRHKEILYLGIFLIFKALASWRANFNNIPLLADYILEKVIRL
jgi:hypothetical protein